MGLEKALVNVFDGSDELAEGLANAVVMASLEAVKERGRFTIAVTSGQSLEILASILTVSGLPCGASEYLAHLAILR